MSPLCPTWLAEHLRAHRDCHGPHYQGYLADHLPMALLAMHGLGVGRAQLVAYATDYVNYLDPPVDHATDPPDSIMEAIGDLSSYGALLAYFDREIASGGVVGTLTTYLPKLISGWVRYAFHPIIRLAYGIRFGVASEVAAGLAYLTCAGPDDDLLALAGSAPRRDELHLPGASPTNLDEPFDARYNATVASGALTGRVAIVPDGGRTIAELGLALFNDTHDFFALHIVTGTHALGVCADAINLNVDGLRCAGVLAAYLTIGAPPFDRQARASATSIDDEHDAKMAYSCIDQARDLRSARFEEAAAVYAGFRQTRPD